MATILPGFSPDPVRYFIRVYRFSAITKTTIQVAIFAHGQEMFFQEISGIDFYLD